VRKIDTIIFDLGGVLIDWNPDYLFDSIFTSPEEKKFFFEQVCTPDWNEEQDAGRSIEEGTNLLIQQYPDHEANIRLFYDQWEQMLNGPIQETVDIFKALKDTNQFKFYALTNWSAELFPVALNKYDFLHWFDGRVVSGEEKTRKPYKDIYQTIINRYNLTPATTLFTDDNLRNIYPAQELGLQTIHFQHPAQFKMALEELNIL
jgi:2-haloacid dehalogenase